MTLDDRQRVFERYDIANRISHIEALDDKMAEFVVGEIFDTLSGFRGDAVAQLETDRAEAGAAGDVVSEDWLRQTLKHVRKVG